MAYRLQTEPWTLHRLKFTGISGMSFHGGLIGVVMVFFFLSLMGYGFIRFIIEFVRQPDPHLNYPWFIFTMGQLLCTAMMATGIAILLFKKKRLRPPRIKNAHWEKASIK